MKLLFFWITILQTYSFSTAECITMPTEKIYSYSGLKCYFSDTIICPYDHPYLDQNFKNYVNKYCESTKICCAQAPENTLPHNKYKLQEILKKIDNSDSIKDKQTAKEIEKILQPTTIKSNIQKKKEENETSLFILHFIVGCLFLIPFLILYFFFLQ